MSGAGEKNLIATSLQAIGSVFAPVSHPAVEVNGKSNPPAMSHKINLLGKTKEQLETFFEEQGEKKFRAAQLFKWIHQLGVTDFDQMTNISAPLRRKLSEIAEITPPEVVHRQYSKDGTRKWVFRVGEGEGSLIETVLIPANDKTGIRKTLCVSSQVGCALDCQFCSTGKQGFQRDLLPEEIIGQLWVANQSYMEDVPVADRTRTVTNVVMMGMGEPLLNYDAVVSSMKIMLDDHAYGMSKRRVTLSTSGIVPKIDQLADEMDIALAISLHAPNNQLRDILVPINKKYPLEALIPSAQRFLSKNGGDDSNRKHVTIEYVMLKDVNDKPEHAKQLIKLLKNLPSKINLIPFNPFPYAPYERSDDKTVLSFQNQLNQAGFVCTIRSTRGDDIDAACGQLVGKVKDRTRRAERWQAKVAEHNYILRTND